MSFFVDVGRERARATANDWRRCSLGDVLATGELSALRTVSRMSDEAALLLLEDVVAAKLRPRATSGILEE